MRYGIREQIEAIERWQKCEFVHPLTCGNDSNHGLLVSKHINAEDVYGECTYEKDWIILTCPDCDYVQNFIPEYIFALTHFKIEKFEELFKRLSNIPKDKS